MKQAIAEEDASKKTGEVYCIKHGWYTQTSISVVKSGCPKCNGSDTEFVVQENERRAKAEKINGLLKLSLIPKRFTDKSFDNYSVTLDEQAMALGICKDYAADFNVMFAKGAGLVMCGMPGTGKTHLACAVGNHLINNLSMQPEFLTVIEAIRRVKDTYGTAKSEQVALNDFCKPHLLILDEVGVQFGTDTEKLILFEIINNRYKDMKPTILISNLSVDKLKDYIGERVVDRMREGGGELIGFNWESHRGKAA